MSVAECDALAWWVQRLYLEGLSEEFSDSNAQPSGAGPQQNIRTDSTVFDGTPGELAAFGFNEQTLGG
jgi:hypothetical protein